jgi:ADP-ribose pyrophosphatase YjhB (NUDIX family)
VQLTVSAPSGEHRSGRLAFGAGRAAARAWGWLPCPTLKLALLYLLGPRFLVSVVAVVFDEQARVLLLRHTHDRPHPWGLPSGRLEHDESPCEAVVRELAEEAGLSARVLAPVAAAREDPLPVLRLAYLVAVTGAFRPSVEVTEARYFAVDELPSSVRHVQRLFIAQAWKMRNDACESW